MEKEVRIQVPEGMEIDKENSTFECIKFKPIQKKSWRDNENATFDGYYISAKSGIHYFNNCVNTCDNYNIFATEKQVKSALAMARISQIMANDKRFGGLITNEEWKINSNIRKYVICRGANNIFTDSYCNLYHFLSFHTEKQRDLFLKENEDLVRDYLMID